MEMQWSREGLGRNFHPGAFTCLHEKARADQTFDDTGGRVGGNLQRVFDVSDRQHRHTVVDDLFDHGANDFRTAGVVAAIRNIRMLFHCQARLSVRVGTAAGMRGPAWPGMICSSRTGTLSANR